MTGIQLTLHTEHLPSGVLPAVGCKPQRGKFDTAKRVIPTSYRRAVTALGTELTAVTLAGAWINLSELETKWHDLRASSWGFSTSIIPDTNEMGGLSLKLAAGTSLALMSEQCKSDISKPGLGTLHGRGLESRALTLAGVVVVSMPAMIVTAAGSQDGDQFSELQR